MNTETLIEVGYYVSSIGFLIATVITFLTIKKFGKSALGSIFNYLLIGTATFFVITLFQKLGGEFFHISDDSMDIWWHIMFYMALFSYLFGFKALVALGMGEVSTGGTFGPEKKWGLLSIILLVIVFIIPQYVDTFVQAYSASAFAHYGLHHFLAFALAFSVGYYVLNAKKNLGQIGRAIANPIIIAIVALGVQHFWELLSESWKVVDVTSNTGEGVEKIFLTISAICLTYASLRLKSYAVASKTV